MKNKHPKIKELDEFISSIWNEILNSEHALRFAENIMGQDKRIYAIYMTQVYRWSYHSARTLALAGANKANKDLSFMHHCFEHAQEETGHEVLALHDLRKMGIPIKDPETDMPPALPETETLVAYIKHLATSDNPYRMLGYDYWTEKPYHYIKPFMNTMQAAMNLSDKEMTFYKQHEEIDIKHGDDIERIMVKILKDDNQWEEVKKVAEVTLKITFNMIISIIKEYELLIEGRSKDFNIINEIIK